MYKRYIGNCITYPPYVDVFVYVQQYIYCSPHLCARGHVSCTLWWLLLPSTDPCSGHFSSPHLAQLLKIILQQSS